MGDLVVPPHLTEVSSPGPPVNPAVPRPPMERFNQDLPVEDVVGHVDPPAYRFSILVILATRSE